MIKQKVLVMFSKHIKLILKFLTVLLLDFIIKWLTSNILYKKNKKFNFNLIMNYFSKKQETVQNNIKSY